MNRTSLLQDYLSYFQQAQASWDQYFSKWETLAEEENKGEGNVLPDEQVETVRILKKRDLTGRQLRKKSNYILNRKRFESRRKGKRKCKKERVQKEKIRDQKRKTKIIHTTENQTNLECEDLNNKHFEADLKAIFIEILSENTNKTEIFSVLSRIFSRIAEPISNFSLSPMIMKKNGFSISPVSKTVLHSASSNEFPLGGIPWGEISDAAGRSCVIVTEHNASNVQDLRMGHSFNPNEEHQKMNNSPQKNQSIVTNDKDDINPECQEYVNEPMLKNDNLDQSSSPSKKVFNSLEMCSHKKNFDPSNSISPNDILRKILQTCPKKENLNRKCKSEKIKKRKILFKYFSESSDEDSERDGIDDSPGKFIKIFCTPKRRKQSKRSNQHEESELEEDIDLADHEFIIFDRVKTDKN